MEDIHISMIDSTNFCGHNTLPVPTIYCPHELRLDAGELSRMTMDIQLAYNLSRHQSLGPIAQRALTHWALIEFTEILDKWFPAFLVINSWCLSCKIALRWMPHNLANEKSTMVRVMVWCRQATSHYMSQCWPRSISSYVVTMPQWVKLVIPKSLTYVWLSHANLSSDQNIIFHRWRQ